MTINPDSLVTRTDLDQYLEDGVVCLRRVFDSCWIERTRAGIQRNLKHPGRFFRDHTPDDSPGRYVFDYWTWPAIPEFRDLVYHSPAAGVAARLLQSARVCMAMDNWFLREAGATTGAPWHHDEPYFDFEGRLCILWFALEPVSAEEGLCFIAGSHRWGKLFVAPQFSANVPFHCTGDAYELVPDLDSCPDRYRRLSFDTEPGDCLVFDFRTLHGSGARQQRLPAATSHRMSLRFGAEGTVFRPRGQWTEEQSRYLMEAGQVVGEPLDCPLTPLLTVAATSKGAMARALR